MIRPIHGYWMMRKPQSLANYISWSEPREQEFDLATIESSPNVIFLADADLRLTYCNHAWDRFALENGGERATTGHVLGSDLMKIIPAPLRQFYSETFAACRRRRLACELAYECSSAGLFRLMHMSILPLRHDNDLALVSRLRAEHEHEPERQATVVADHHFSPDGTVTQCSHCRRTQRQQDGDAWEWVPDFLRLQDWKVVHGLCGACTDYFYPRHANVGR